MRLNEYMSKTFLDLELRKPLFYSWDIGIRFELGVDYDFTNLYPNCPYLERVYNRGITLFEALHPPQDDIYIVVNVNDFGDGKAFKKKLNVFSKYVKEKPTLFELQQHTIPYIYPEDNEEGKYVTHRFSLRCKSSDFNYIPMLKAICNQDMGIGPSIFHEVFMAD